MYVNSPKHHSPKIKKRKFVSIKHVKSTFQIFPGRFWAWKRMSTLKGQKMKNNKRHVAVLKQTERWRIKISQNQRGVYKSICQLIRPLEWYLLADQLILKEINISFASMMFMAAWKCCNIAEPTADGANTTPVVMSAITSGIRQIWGQKTILNGSSIMT